jgi:predicted O-linked N-acetylglucosamine transferase (SPINDLY family)
MLANNYQLDRLELIETLIKNNKLGIALNLLKEVEETGFSNDDTLKRNHAQLMMKVLAHYKNIKNLEQLEIENQELAFLYLNFQEFKKAHVIFEKLYLQEPNNFAILYGFAKSSLELDLAIDPQIFYSLEEKSWQAPDKIDNTTCEYHTEVCELLGDFYLERDKKKALYFFEQALKRSPLNPSLNFKFAHLHFSIYQDIYAIEKFIPYALEQANTSIEKGCALHYAIILAREKNEEDKRELVKSLTNELECLFPQDLAIFHELRGEFYSFNGDIDKAMTEYFQAVSHDPSFTIAHDNLIMISHYSHLITSEQILEFSQNYYQKCIRPFLEQHQINFDFSNLIRNFQENSKKTIKVGLVSPDFKNHPVFFWISSLLKHAPSDSDNNFEIHCYSSISPNQFSESLRSVCHKLEYINHLSDLELAEKIYDDEIHILVDLSGHTAANRLKTFALKPAPLQITWLGQAGPMGLPQIDYMIADPFLVREGEEVFFTEKIYRMPHCFAPYSAQDYENLQVNRSLARNDGVIVLGSFNNSMKINKEVLEAWAQILNSVPKSILLMSNHNVHSTNYRKKILDFFGDHGVDKERIEFENPSDKHAYFQRFNKIDIALDPFPFTGGTTTHETLMMSIPLISINGAKLAHRNSASILYFSKLDELIAIDQTDYINKLILLANSPERIIHYKSHIREKYLNSAAADMKSFSKDFFNGLRDLWEQKILTNHSLP